MAHSDDLGLVLPALIAPTKIIVLNLMPKNQEVSAAAENLTKALQAKYLAILDATDKSASYKKAEATIKGIPLIIELGQQELAKQEVKITSRHNLAVTFVSMQNHDELLAKVDNLLANSNQELLVKSTANFNDNLKEVTDFKAYQEIIKIHKGYIIAPFCGDMTQESEIKAQTSTTSRCIPLKPYKPNAKCFKCGRDDCP